MYLPINFNFQRYQIMTINFLVLLILEGNPFIFAEFLNFLKTGYRCKDCGENFEKCECEKCKDCGFIRCLCELNIEYKGDKFEDYTSKERILIRNLIYKWLFSLNKIKEADFKEIKERLYNSYIDNKNMTKYYKLFFSKKEINQIKEIYGEL